MLSDYGLRPDPTYRPFSLAGQLLAPGCFICEKIKLKKFRKEILRV